MKVTKQFLVNCPPFWTESLREHCHLKTELFSFVFVKGWRRYATCSVEYYTGIWHTVSEIAGVASSVEIRIRDPGSGACLTPGSGMGKKSGSGHGIRIRDEQPGSYFRELKTIFWVKILKFFNVDPGSRMKKNRIRDGNKSNSGSGSATMVAGSSIM